MTSQKWVPLHKFDTEFNADSVEWCPHKPWQHVFVCGTYQLEENTENEVQKRIGQILLFSLVENQLKCEQKIETSAILDQKWCLKQITHASILATATALGEIQMYELNSDNENVNLKLLTTVKLENNSDGEILSLALDWSVPVSYDPIPKLIVSDSTGHISIYRFDNNKLNLVCNWKAHDFEAWTCAFDCWDENIILTGGDDSKFKMYDVRNLNNPVFVSKAHSAGVTSFQFNRKYENIFVSGSYDENILIWDKRSIKSPLSNIKTSGGVWRLKWNPFTYKTLLTACMYGAFHIVNVNDFSFPNIIADYCEHSSICYGADWSHLKSQNDVNFIATCSFYDHLLNVSQINHFTSY